MKTFKKILINYLIVFIYIFLSVLIELVGTVITDGKFYISDPRYFLTMLGIGCIILILIKNQRARVITGFSILLVQGIFNIFFIVLFEMAGQWFDFSMLSLRNDAMGILESLPVNFWYFFMVLILLSALLVFGLKISTYLKTHDIELTKKGNIIKNLVCYGLMVVLLLCNILTAFSINGTDEDKYKNLLYSNSSSKYNQYGITSNFVNELYSGTVFSNDKTLPSNTIEEFLYKDTYTSSDVFGVSKGNNVVTILGETFEWLSFMPDGYEFKNGETLVFPNGMKLSEIECRELFPNLWEFYDNSYIMTNYHAREKTDISENYSILGSYPIGKYINYDYYNNVLPQSMPNTLREVYKDNYQAYYFHNGYADFYNREKSILGLGFDECYTTERMLKINSSSVFNDYGADGERNLDSEMVSKCKDLMFPTDKKFYTYITTITMHGMYSKKRNNLSSYYEDLKKYGLDIDDDISDEEFIFYSYLACAKETDKAIGIILDTLEEKNLLDNTTIVLFGDHQGYYEGLSNYVKSIDGYKQCIEEDLNYLDLYKVPMMIFDKKLVNLVTNNHTDDSLRFSSKFSSSCDIVPTLLDILGIKYYSNIYYGNSVFSDTISLIYSRGYGYFLDEYSYFYNINKFQYINPSITDDEAYIKKIEERGNILIEKIRHVDNSFKIKLFNNETGYNKYITNMINLNK